MTVTRATIAGAGLAGLSAAVRLAESGLKVSIYEAAAQAGGRCRSYCDSQLDMTIDNGNHLVFTGNDAVKRFRHSVGATDPLAGPKRAEFAFVDLGSGDRWTIRPNDGRLPWWVLDRSRRVPGTRAAEYLELRRLLRAAVTDTVGGRVDARGTLWCRLIEPALLAMLNTPPEAASAKLASAVLEGSLLRGGRASAPRIAMPNLDAAFIGPALRWLEAHGAAIQFGARLRAIVMDDKRVTALDWGNGPVPVAEDEAVVMAVPPWVAKSLLPSISTPDAFHAIVSGHFASVAPPPNVPLMLGVLGGTAQWLFAFENRISVTVSAAGALVEADREELARLFWNDIQRAYGFTAEIPPWQIVKEKRATFAATPDQDTKRPPSQTRWKNLFLAGDWIQTGLPATIEGALLSGEMAAKLVSGNRGGY